MDNFDNIWETVNYLNTIQTTVYSDINILFGATEEFIQEVTKIENIKDPWSKAIEAESYLKQHNGIEMIDYITLRSYLAAPLQCSLEVWRKLYLLERSIPRRSGDTLTWIERLKKFVDTNTLEYAVNGRKLDGLPGKIFFAKKSGDHRNLHCGRGENWPDFYVWDDTINHWFAWLEFKHWGSSNIETAKNFYKDHKYNARYVLVCLNDLTFHLIDYDTDAIIAQPNLKAPDNLLLW